MSARDRLSRGKDWVNIIYSFLMILAAIAALILFWLQREGYRHANVDHEVTHRALDDRWVWIQAGIRIENTGRRLLHFDRATVRMQRVLPLEPEFRELLAEGQSIIPGGKRRVPWRRIGDAYNVPTSVRLEPGETDVTEYEFVIPCHIKTVRIYSYLEKSASPSYGWSHSSIYDIPGKEGCDAAWDRNSAVGPRDSVIGSNDDPS